MLIGDAACPACARIVAHEECGLHNGDILVCPHCATPLSFTEAHAWRVLGCAEFERLDPKIQGTITELRGFALARICRAEAAARVDIA